MSLHDVGVKKVVGDDAIVVSPTMLASWGAKLPLVKQSSERTPYDIYGVLSEDIKHGARYLTPRKIVGLTTIMSSPRTFFNIYMVHPTT